MSYSVKKNLAVEIIVQCFVLQKIPEELNLLVDFVVKLSLHPDVIYS